MSKKANGFLSVTSVLLIILVCLVAFLAYSHIPRPSETISTITSSIKPAKKSFSFNAAGDFKNGTNASAVLKAMGDDPVDFSLALGDLSYGPAGSEQAWCDLVLQNIGNTRPFQLIVGNHADGTNTSDHADFNEFRKCLPNKIDGISGDYGTEYYFDYNHLARFIMIAPDINNYGYSYAEGDTGGEHLQWLINAINEARDKKINWIIVGMHKNCISISTKTCEIGEDLLNNLLSLDVDLILQGHEHIYARTKQLGLDDKTCPLFTINAVDADCIVDDGDNYSKGKGSIIVISGAGGYDLRNINTSDPEFDYFKAYNGLNMGGSFGFAHFDVSESKLEGSFVPAIGNYTDSSTINAN